MRIVFLLPIADMSGGNRVVSIYAKALGQRGHAVTVISPPRRRRSFKNKVRSLLKNGVWDAEKMSPMSHLDNLGVHHQKLETYRAIESKDIPDADVIVATWWETAEWLSRIDPQKGAKAYFIQHHEVFPYLPVERAKATYKMPLHKIVIAKWLRTVMSEEYGDTHVDLVPNSIDRNQFNAPPRTKQSRPTVGFLFSAEAFKGVDVTLRAIRLLRERFSNLRVVSFGNSEPVHFPDWDSEIEFERSPAQDRLRGIYAQCDVWITASRSEGFNLPAMEAMGCRTPVVSTRTGWPEEAIGDNVNGFLVDIDDSSALAAQTARILTLESETWQTMSLLACRTATSGSWEQSTLWFEESLLKCIQRSANKEI